MKTYGTRAEVYNNIAHKTRGGLTKDDIIQKGDRFLSKRVSERMRDVNKNPLSSVHRQRRKNRIKSIKNTSSDSSTNTSSNSSDKRNRRLKRRKKTRKRVKFNLQDNKTTQYYCPELNESDYDIDDDIEEININKPNKKKFVITEPPEIDFDELFV